MIKTERHGGRFRRIACRRFAAAQLTPAQREAVDAFRTARGAEISGPFYPLLRSPELMTRTRAMGDYLRYKSALPPRLSEFVILLTAREWTQQYEWNAHYPIAVKAGVKREILDAIAEGRRPSAMSDEETILYEFCQELHHDKAVSDATYARALKAFGEQGVVDAIGISGYYTLLAMTLNTARTPAGENRQPDPAADSEVDRVKIFGSSQPKDRSMKNFRRGVLLCLLLAATAGCDRVTKHLAVTTLAGMPEQSFLADTIRLDYHENPGGFLSAGATWRLKFVTAVFQVGERRSSCSQRSGHGDPLQWSRLAAVGLVLFLAGGISNLVDRIAMGSVIDFLNIGIGPFRTGIFNVADVAIMVGIALCLIVDHRNSRSVSRVCNGFHSYTPSWADSSSADKTSVIPVCNRLAFDMHSRKHDGASRTARRRSGSRWC